MGKRILTGIVGVPIVILCIFGPMALTYLFALVLMGMLNYEIALMKGYKLGEIPFVLSIINMILAFVGYLLFSENLSFTLVFVNSLLIAETVFAYPRISLNNMLYLAFMNLYCNWLPIHLLSIKMLDDGSWLLMSTFILIWICDSGAYFSGRLFGRHKMAPQLSPKKTIEGALGGIALTIIVCLIIQHFMPLASSTGYVIFFAALVAFGAIVGDLFESFLKRTFNIKDSGHLLPGHGGFADRFDSFILVAPLCYSYFQLFNI